MNQNVNHLARPMPRATAQVEPYVEVLGAELTVMFLLQFGGAELHFSADPNTTSAVVRLLGHENTKALANSTAPCNDVCRSQNAGWPRCSLGKATQQPVSPAACASQTALFGRGRK